MPVKKNLLLLLFTAISTSTAVAETASVSLSDTHGLTPHKVSIEATEYLGRQSIRVSDPGDLAGNNEDKLVLLEHRLQDGTIEVELAGAPGEHAAAAARGFVGIAFRSADDASSFEALYLRPTNGRAEDQLRRNHSVQYISFPEHPWHRLREETPGVYESYVDLVPGEWTSVKIVIEGQQARLYVHGADQPTLIVNDLKLGARDGAVALWIGPGTEAHFTDLRITTP